MEPTSYDPPLSTGDIIRAPGKIVLAGEYAILDGAPAVVLAINRGVQCTIEKGSGISVPNGDTRFVEHALPFAENHHLNFQDWNPIEDFAEHQKPGFGGSAAACTIATHIMGQPLEDTIGIHNQVQGSGSGIDVKASILGGMFIWNPLLQETHVVASIHPVVIWTGTSARTGPRVQQYLSYQNRNWFVQNSIRFTDLFLEDPIRGTKALYNNLVMMSKEANLHYTTHAIREIVRLADQHGGAAKPSGAGGGDCMVAFFHSEEEQIQFIETIQQHPIYQVIDYAISEGVHVVKKTQ